MAVAALRLDPMTLRLDPVAMREDLVAGRPDPVASDGGCGGPVYGLIGPVHRFFYFIYRGGHDNRLGKSLIYFDLSTEAVAKPTGFLPATVKFFLVVAVPLPQDGLSNGKGTHCASSTGVTPVKGCDIGQASCSLL